MNHDETLNVRRRNRLKHHFTMTPNVLLFGYRSLTDADKITFQVIDSFDWSDGAGLRKGYAFPSLRRIADARSCDERTIRRHLAALERVGLLTRERRPGQPSLLWIEEPSAEENQRYLSTIAIGPDTDVRDTPDTDVRPYKQDKEQERQNPDGEAGRRTPSEGERAKRDWLAGEMLTVLGGLLDLKLYQHVAENVPEHRIFEALSEVKLAAREGRIRKSKTALFTALIERKEMKHDKALRGNGERPG